MVEIENMYDYIEWDTIFDTFKIMNFSAIWIFSIKTCISSATFSLLINNQPFDWIPNHRGVRQK